MPMEDWSRIELALYNEAFDQNASVFEDQWVQTLYDNALFGFQDLTHDQRVDAQRVLYDYLYDNYGMDFDEVFDWEGYRAAYDTNQV